MNNEDKYFIIGYFTMVITIVVLVIVTIARDDTGVRLERIREAACSEGHQAHDVGLPATANPYNGSEKPVWLKGWMDAATKPPPIKEN